MNFKIGSRLHLGCGEQYKEGYVNVDYPRSEHSVSRPKVDLEGDIMKLDYGEGELGEVRLHHVFEHFYHWQQMVLMSRWSRGLAMGGLLWIEVPDFEECVREFLRRDFEGKMKIVRHVEGSQEQHWAVHYAQMWEGSLRYLFEEFGFGEVEIKRRVLVGLPNIEIKGRKWKEMEYGEASKKILGMWRVNASEKKLWDYWIRLYEEEMK